MIVTEVYAAREQPIPGVSGRQVAEAATGAGAKTLVRAHAGRRRQACVRRAATGRRRSHPWRRRHHPGRSRAGPVAGRGLKRELGGARRARRCAASHAGRTASCLRGLGFFRVRRVEIAGLQYLAPAKIMTALGLATNASVFDDPAPLARRALAVPGIKSAVDPPAHAGNPADRGRGGGAGRSGAGRRGQAGAAGFEGKGASVRPAGLGAGSSARGRRRRRGRGRARARSETTRPTSSPG